MPLTVFKPANVSFGRDVANGTFLFDEPYFINYTYSDGNKVYLKKESYFKDSTWDNIEKLKDFPAIFYINDSTPSLSSEKHANVCPIILNRNTILCSSGECLSKGVGDKRTDLRVFVEHALRKAATEIPNFLFSKSGKFLVEAIIPSYCGIAALRSNGDAMVFNKKNWDNYNGVLVFDSDAIKMKLSKSYSQSRYYDRECWD
jgi:hypothetical protein